MEIATEHERRTTADGGSDDHLPVRAVERERLLVAAAVDDLDDAAGRPERVDRVLDVLEVGRAGARHARRRGGARGDAVVLAAAEARREPVVEGDERRPRLVRREGEASEDRVDRDLPRRGPAPAPWGADDSLPDRG